MVSKLAIPRPPSLPLKPQLLLHLRTIWSIASTNANALNELRAAIQESHYDTPEHRLLVHCIVSLQPPNIPPIDGYTLELVQSLWDIALISPDCVEQKNRGVPAYDAPLFALDWCIWKLNHNGDHRARSAASSPIAKLPVETLTLIFEWLRYASPSFPTDQGNIISHLAARAVCKHWKTILEAKPSLWTDMITGCGVWWTKRALRLSANAEINVREYVTTHDPSRTASALLCMSELHRICGLDISSPWSVQQLVAVLLASSEAPCLESLALRPNDYDDPPDGRHIGRLPSQLFLGQSPARLREIVIENYSLPLTCLIFAPSLIYIDLTCCRVWLSLESLLETLRTLSALEVFRWHMPGNVLTSMGNEMRFPQTRFLTAWGPSATLPRLKDLSLGFPAACFAALMTHVSIPPPCSIHLHDDYTFSGDRVLDDAILNTVYRQIDSCIGAHLEKAPRSDPVSGFDILRILECLQTEPGRGALVVEGQRRSKKSPQAFSLTFVASNVRDGSLEVDTLRPLVSHILEWPILGETVTTVHTNHVIMSSENLWVAVLHHLPHVTQIEIENSSDTDASSALHGLAGALLQAEGLVPELTDIVLSHIELGLAVQRRLAAAIDRRQRLDLPHLRLTLGFRGRPVDIRILEEALARSGGKLKLLGSYDIVY